MTTELIKDLVGLCVENRLFMLEDDDLITVSCHLRKFRVEIDLRSQDSPAQLQAAIDKVR